VAVETKGCIPCDEDVWKNGGKAPDYAIKTYGGMEVKLHTSDKHYRDERWKVKFVQLPHHEDVWRSGGKYPRIIKKCKNENESCPYV
jgi:DNA-binding protein H-NS